MKSFSRLNSLESLVSNMRRNVAAKSLVNSEKNECFIIWIFNTVKVQPSIASCQEGFYPFLHSVISAIKNLPGNRKDTINLYYYMRRETI